MAGFSESAAPLENFVETNRKSEEIDQPVIGSLVVIWLTPDSHTYFIEICLPHVYLLVYLFGASNQNLQDKSTHVNN
jgi:hypothetical protein